MSEFQPLDRTGVSAPTAFESSLNRELKFWEGFADILDEMKAIDDRENGRDPSGPPNMRSRTRRGDSNKSRSRQARPSAPARERDSSSEDEELGSKRRRGRSKIARRRKPTPFEHITDSTPTSGAEFPPASTIERTPSSGVDAIPGFMTHFMTNPAAVTYPPTPNAAALSPPPDAYLLADTWNSRREAWVKFAFDTSPDDHEVLVAQAGLSGDNAVWAAEDGVLEDLATSLEDHTLPSTLLREFTSEARTLLWASAEAMAANTLSVILGRRPRVFEVRRMCKMALDEQSKIDMALVEIWLSALVRSPETE